MAKNSNNAGDIRLKTPDETNDLLLDLKREQLNLRFQRATGQQENTSQMRKTRRDVARVKTIMGERVRASAKV